uniref:Non-selective voltage-gated ion channel VDAC2 n=1 Tax=Oreochromis aureus TaxID=47969 RepID=A0A668T1L7_OREAU
MAVPPSYADLGKSAKDIFNKGYGFGQVKLDVKTKSASGVEFKTSGSSNTDTSKVVGSLETKYKRSEYGLTFTEKWNTDNTLGTEITVEDQIAKGLKLTFDTTFSPNTGKKSGKVKAAYKREYVNLGCDVDFDFAGPTIHGAAVIGYEGWLAGYQMSFDTAKSKMARNNFAIGYKTGDFQLHTNVNDGAEFGGSIYQKVSDSLETAVNLAWTAGSNSTRFGIAAKYQLDKDASISAKVNNNSLVGVGYTQTLRPGELLFYRCETDPFWSGRRKEHQCRRPQAGSWLGTGSLSFLHTGRTREYQKNLALNVMSNSSQQGDILERMVQRLLQQTLEYHFKLVLLSVVHFIFCCFLLCSCICSRDSSWHNIYKSCHYSCPALP